MNGSLSGITVVDFSWGIAGPMASGQLADHGATVIRVEPPSGDPYRPFVSGAVYDRGKLSVHLDLRTDDGRAAAAALIDRSDVVIQAWSPGVADRYGLGSATLRQRNPGLIHCTLSGYGGTPGDEDRVGYDALVSARIGAMWEQTAASDTSSPVYLAVPIASIGAAMLVVIGVVAALYEREATGTGCEVETSLLDGALAFLNMFWEDLESVPAAGPTTDAADRRRYRLLVKSFRCADGEFLGIHTGAGGSHARLMEALGLSERVRPAEGTREKLVLLSPEEADIVETEVPRIFGSQPRDHWLKLLQQADVTAIPVLRQTEAFDADQTRHIGMVVELSDDVLGPVEQVGVPARLSRSPGQVRKPAPRPGQHTESVLGALRASRSKAQFATMLESDVDPC
jgi:crotonobetainyl-CoA:carnitine CoA-transferase CaiB-like acyl-CoA transferase